MLHFSKTTTNAALCYLFSCVTTLHFSNTENQSSELQFWAPHTAILPSEEEPRPPPPQRNETKHTDTHFKSGLAPVSQQQNTQTWLWFRQQSGIIGHGIFVHFDLKDLAKMEYHPSPICNCTRESMHSLRLSNRNIVTEVSIGLHCIWKEKRKKWLST